MSDTQMAQPAPVTHRLLVPGRDVALAHATEQAYQFLEELPGFDPARATGRRRSNPVNRDLDADFLDMVMTGRWTVAHDEAAKALARLARRQASRLVAPWRRRALTRALESAACVVLTDRDGREPLPASVRSRLLAPWQDLTQGA
jgi:hypothetical protein